MTIFQTAAQMTSCPYNRTVVGVGDSRFAREVYSDATLSVTKARSVLAWARDLTDQSFDHDVNNIVAEGGASSERVLELVRAQIGDIVGNNFVPAPNAKLAGVYVLNFSTNDASVGLTVAQSVAAMETVQDICIASGGLVVWMNEWPKSGAISNGKLRHLTCSAWIDAQRDVPGVIVVPTFQAMLDPTDANIVPASGYYYDGLHQNNAGGYRIAKLLVPIFERLFPPRNLKSNTNGDVYDAINHPRGILNANPMLRGSAGTTTPGAGTITGNSPDGWTLALTNGAGLTVTTTPDHSEDGLSWFKMVVSGTPTASGAVVSLLSSASVHSSISAADIIDQIMQYKIASGSTGVVQPQMEQILNGFTHRTMQRETEGSLSPSSDVFTADAVAGSMRIPAHIAGSPATGFCKPALYVYFVQNVAVTFTILIRAFGIRKVIP